MLHDAYQVELVKRLLEKASSDFQQESGILELFFAL
jgi:hypothetical protein